MKKDIHGLSINIRVCSRAAFISLRISFYNECRETLIQLLVITSSTIPAHHQVDASFSVRQSCVWNTRRYSNMWCSIIMHTNARTSIVNEQLMSLRYTGNWVVPEGSSETLAVNPNKMTERYDSSMLRVLRLYDMELRANHQTKLICGYFITFYTYNISLQFMYVYIILRNYI